MTPLSRIEADFQLLKRYKWKISGSDLVFLEGDLENALQWTLDYGYPLEAGKYRYSVSFGGQKHWVQEQQIIPVAIMESYQKLIDDGFSSEDAIQSLQCIQHL